MATGRNHKELNKSSKYKYVRKKIGEKGYVNWVARVLGAAKCFNTEREAAKWVDLKLIDKGKEPVNILVRR
jgi:hypothetical protein